MVFRQTQDARRAEHSLRLVTYNIHKGVQGVGPLKRLEIHNLRGAIAQLNSDIVCLQEVRCFNTQLARRFKNWPQSTQSDFLTPEGYYSAYTTNAVTRYGEHGNAVLSKWPIIRNQHEDVSDHSLEQRGLLHVVIDYKGLHIHVIVLHLGLFARSRKRQIEKLRSFIQREIGPKEVLIVAGDFNDWSGALTPMINDMGLTHSSVGQCKGNSLSLDVKKNNPKISTISTFPARLPLVQLDYVYSKGLSALDCYTPTGKQWSRLSDHLPLIVEFDRISGH